MDSQHFVAAVPNHTAVAFGLIAGMGEGKLTKRVHAQLTEITTIRQTIFGPPSSGYTNASLRLAKAFEDNVSSLHLHSLIANMAFYGSEAIQLLCSCVCNRLQAVDCRLRTGNVEEAASLTSLYLETLCRDWHRRIEGSSALEALGDMACVWLAQLRKLSMSSQLVDITSPQHLPFRRLMEQTKGDCCLLPAREGWLVCTYPDSTEEMSVIGEGTDVPHALLDALTSLLPADAEPNK